ncbi:aminomethyl-transferring glycine dehydrogenase subunit GcvPA [Hespellia stercorisuis]|uniref:Probable glycine dehydrogenase (decarboxylating) subunit 1 n=1 Tax=Hespellia stercorisuis DSM 15480 TaxID=1121950 RepID=A0A1M6MM68_9FIRM|nr:aminomethyl-transferring glycine dehydrogenase subunit GcvPA [Hespellia stercorisuis]SHJ84552.1 glycine dehydrogenase subunit 1 [Hespellia stercorisuis DSM 15480]
MGNYIPSTQEERAEMLKAVGVGSFDELYAVVPPDMKVDKLNIPDGKSELEVSEIIRGLAAKNKVYGSIFRGAGAYNHYIPSIVKSVTGKEEFLTAYTPYQAEISQGILQSIFEYQTMICELTDMDVSNASVYDGASAAAEAVAMCNTRKRKKAVISGAANPMVIQTILTYCEGSDTETVVVPAKNGKTDLEALKEAMDEKTAGVFVQQPSYFGQIEDAEAIGAAAHEAGAKYIMGIYPIAGAVLKSPRECGADVVTGEGQPLGMSLAFGGPYLGFMACTHDMMRQLPGRIVGETTDVDYNRAYVLTLQAREQHIRREKASSNICSNQALCAMTAAVYMTTMGTTGMKQTAGLCYSKAHYAAEQISKIAGFELVNDGDFFNEFVTKTPCAADVVLKKLADADILGGYPVEEGILWCVTEMNSKAQIDALTTVLKEVRA